jgi:hypothetical protein
MDRARITDKGLMFKVVAYTCERAKQEGWFLKAFNGNMGKEVDIALDPRWTNNMMYEENVWKRFALLNAMKLPGDTRNSRDFATISKLAKKCYTSYSQCARNDSCRETGTGISFG